MDEDPRPAYRCVEDEWEFRKCDEVWGSAVLCTECGAFEFCNSTHLRNWKDDCGDPKAAIRTKVVRRAMEEEKFTGFNRGAHPAVCSR